MSTATPHNISTVARSSTAGAGMQGQKNISKSITTKLAAITILVTTCRR
nr:hypothetical protein [Candidatus Sigynarchaeota archaeon]